MPIHLNQKFQLGDLVRLTTEIPSFMSHFPGWGELCVYAGSYQDKFGGTYDVDARCSLLFPDMGQVSWYYESQLTLVRRGFLGQFIDAGNRFQIECDSASTESDFECFTSSRKTTRETTS